MKSKSELRAVVVLGVVLLLVGGWWYANRQAERSVVTKELAFCSAKLQQNAKTVAFLRFFIVKIVNAESEVGLADRFRLETMIQELNNEQILKQWRLFMTSRSQIEARRNLRLFLELLVSNINV